MRAIERQSSASWISEAAPNLTLTPRGCSTAPQAFDSLFASGELLPTQLATRSNWGAEKKLAAAVLENALAEIRDHFGAKGHLRAVKDALEWVRSDDTEWPYSFRPLCELFAIDPEWVRERVAVWTVRPRVSEGPRVRYRHAA